MDANTNTFDDEAVPDIRLKDGLDVHKLQLGEAQEFEVADDDDEQDGKVIFNLKAVVMACCCVLLVLCTSLNIPNFRAENHTHIHNTHIPF